VVLERGRSWVFASAVDWPGWCRRGKGGDEAALDALADYADRYRRVVADLPTALPASASASSALTDFDVLEALPGSATTDFGAPEAIAKQDEEPADDAAVEHLLAALDCCWAYFDGVVATAPESLRKGPRGGGRDRDAIADHVREAERSYGRKVGARVPPRTPWTEQRDAVRAGLRAAFSGEDVDPRATTKWPPRYLLRRAAWHVLDHAWEIEDKST
jgi:hypothetical protein